MSASLEHSVLSWNDLHSTVLGEGMSVFLNGVIFGIRVTLQGRPHAQEELASWPTQIEFHGICLFVCFEAEGKHKVG